MAPSEDVVKRARAKLSLGRAYAMSKADYYSHILLSMTFEIVDEPKVTMGITRGLVLYVNGDWLLNDPEVQTDEVVGACLIHECEHPLRGMDRLEALPNKEQANIAADAAINENLRDEGWVLPSWVIYPEKLGHPNNLTLEQHYHLLQQEQEKTQKSLQEVMNDKCAASGKKKDPGTGQGKKGDEGKGNSKGESSAQDAPSTWQPKVGSGACGSAGGKAADTELEAQLDGELGKCEAEVDSIRKQVLDDISAQAASGRGNVPGRFREIIATRNAKPDVNWKSILRRILQRSMQKVSGSSDYSLSRPSLSSQLAGYIGPGLIDHKLEVCIVEDTSASMGEHQLQQARNEAFHLMRKAGVETAVHIQADVIVQRARVVRLRDLPKIEYLGRGGTDFRKVFEYIRKRYPRVSLVVYYTDGDGIAPKKPPRGFQVVWCIVRTSYARQPAPWGHLVVCDKDQKLLPPIIPHD